MTKHSIAFEQTQKEMRSVVTIDPRTIGYPLLATGRQPIPFARVWFSENNQGEILMENHEIAKCPGVYRARISKKYIELSASVRVVSSNQAIALAGAWVSDLIEKMIASELDNDPAAVRTRYRRQMRKVQQEKNARIAEQEARRNKRLAAMKARREALEKG